MISLYRGGCKERRGVSPLLVVVTEDVITAIHIQRVTDRGRDRGRAKGGGEGERGLS